MNRRHFGHERMMGMHVFIEILTKFGVSGLLFTMAMEGLSLPIPGIIVVLTMGYILDLNFVQTLWVSAFMSFIYSITSFLPYSIGNRLENVIRKKYSSQMKKAQQFFSKYGEGSIAILRPFAIGNYISYVAGISRVDKRKFAVLTFAGIYPWCFAMLMIGKLSRGNIKYALSLVKSNSIYFYVFASLLVLIIVSVIFYRRMHNKKNKVSD